MVLCDVSDSVRNVSRFMLQFVYSLQDLYSKVRSFIFVADDRRDHAALRGARHQRRRIERRCTGNVINVYAHSDFGRAFKSFHRDYLAAVNKRTTVIVLGDARNNYNLPHEWVLKDVQQRAKQVIWLNPGEPHDLGLRRQRDGPLRAVLRHGRGVPQPEPAVPGHRPPGR